ncbi:MAG: ADOP family duplicated permease [Vicinamibacterales bacterium]
MAPLEPPDDVVARWRREAARIIGGDDRDLVDEVAEHVAARWVRHAALHGAQAADELAGRDLAEWSRPGAPATQPRPSWRVGVTADLRHAARTLRSRPSHTIAAVTLVAVAIAATTTAVALTYGVVWRPLPYPEAGRLVTLWQVVDGETQQISYPDYADLAALSVFDATAAMIGGRGSVRVGDRIERVNVLDIEPAGYALLGARPHLGRLLTADDVGRANAMISHRLWTTHLGSDPGVVGRPLWLSGTTVTVVGVLAPGVDFELPVTPTFALRDHDLWMPFDRRSPFLARRDVTTYEAIARLAPGVDLASARAAVDAVAVRLAADHAATNANRSFRVTHLADDLVKDLRRPLWLVSLAALATFAVALANLATLALLRITDRGVELAIREALGAGHRRLRRLLLLEHAVLALAGGIAGFALARLATATVLAAEVALLPRLDAVRFDLPVVAAAATLVVLVPAVLALLPVPGRGAEILRGGGRTATGGRRLTRALVAMELALAVALSTGGALLGLSLARLFAVDPGFATAGVVTARVSAYAARYPDAPDVQRFVQRVVDTLAAHADVAAVAAGSSLPLSGQNTGTGLVVQGQPRRPADRQTAGWQFVTPGYFSTLGMPLRRGRDFTADDLGHDRHVTIVNERLARALFGDADPIGQRIGSGDGPQGDDWHEVVGVVGDVRHAALDRSPEPRAYDLLGQHWGRTVYVVARSRLADPAAAATTIRATVARLDPDAPVFEAATMDVLADRSAAAYRLAAAMAAALAAVAVVLALLAVYAVAAGSVAARTREIGVRAALGAAPGTLLALVFREGLTTTAAGLVGGVAGAAVLSRLLASRLFGVSPADAWVVIAAVAALIPLVAGLAAWPAARRAAAIDPLDAMRGS